MVVIAFILSVAATTVGSIAGIGGGVIIKPLLDLFSGLPVSEISFLSGCTVLAMSAVSLLKSRRGNVRIEKKRGTELAIGGAIGGILGKSIFDLIKLIFDNDGILGSAQSVLMVLVTVFVLIYVILKDKIQPRNIQNDTRCVTIGGALGLISAFLGIGGGPINIAVLCYFFSMDSKTAALHSIYIILFSQIASLINTVMLNKIPCFQGAMMIAMIVGGIIGGYCGKEFSNCMKNEQIDALFKVLLVFIVLVSVYNLYGYIEMI